MILVKFAWRNIWRNPLRSLILLGAIFIGLIAGIFSMGITNGFIDQRFESLIENQVSHIQIHSAEYIQEPDQKFILSKDSNILTTLIIDPGIKAIAGRSKVNSMIASANNTAGVLVNGVIPELESKLTALSNKLIDGNYFENSNQNELLIGNKLAIRLNVKTGSRIVLTFSDVQNEIVTAAFRIQGIFKTDTEIYDERNVFVNMKVLNKHLNIGSNMHEIALLLNDIEQIDAYKNKLSVIFEDDEVRIWKEISPELSYISEAGGLFGFIFIIIILTGLTFGILNTMLMTIFERTHEIGMMMAIGMNRFRVFSLIILETIFLSVFGGILGLVAGYILINRAGSTGIDFAKYSESLSAYGYASVIYPSLDINSYFIILGLVISMALIASIYPSLKAIRLIPVEAVRQ